MNKVYLETMGIQNTTKTVLWIPSGGLGHCLHNLAWTYSECIRLKSKLYIYGFHNHIPFQHYASEFLVFLKNVEVEELKNRTQLNNFISKYNISKKGINLIENSSYKTNVKIISDDKTVSLVCSALSKNTIGLFEFNKMFVQSILDNPYKYYNNDYGLLIDTNIKYCNYFKIEGSYMKALMVLNKHLNISSNDNNYLNSKKTLTVTYTTLDNTQHTINCIEYSKHYIPNILRIDKAVYGVRDKVIDVTKIVINKLCTKYEITDNETISKNTELCFEIKGSYYMALKVSNKQLGITNKDSEYYNIPKTLTIKYENTDGKIVSISLIEKSTNKIKNIRKIIRATYGIKDKQIDVTQKITNLCYSIPNITKTKQVQNKNEKKINIEKQKQNISSIIASKKYIAVHFRFRDKKVFGGYKKKLSEINHLIKKTKIKNIFVSTDSPMFFNYLGNNLQDAVIFRFTNPPDKGINIHYNNTDFVKGENFYKTILDMYMCKRAAHFIPSLGSGFSNTVIKMNYI